MTAVAAQAEAAPTSITPSSPRLITPARSALNHRSRTAPAPDSPVIVHTRDADDHDQYSGEQHTAQLRVIADQASRLATAASALLA